MSLTFPVLLPQAWCSGGGANQGLLNTLGTITNNVLSSPANQPSASLADGFPIDNMSAGGYAPNGGDMNAALYYITLFQAWVNAGQMFPFNSTLATDLGGYPIGTTLMLGTGTQAVMSTAASNSTNPNSSMTGWQYTYGQAVGTGASVALSAAYAGCMYYNSVDGLMLQARSGSAYDFTLVNPSGSAAVFSVPTGTLNVGFSGSVTAPVLQTGASTSGTSGSMSYNSVNGLVIWGKTGTVYDLDLTSGSGTSTMAVPTGTTNSTFFGTVTAPVLQTGASTSGTSGSMFYNSANGLTIWGKTGTVYDLDLTSGSGANVMLVPTGTTNTIWPGKQTWTPLANASPALGDMWMDSTQQTLCAEEGASGNPVKIYKSGVLATSKTVGGYNVTCTTSGTYTYDFLPSANFLNTLTLPANFWTVGKSVKIEMWMHFTMGATVSLFDANLLFGGIIVSAPSISGTPFVASAGYTAKLEAVLTCTATGAAGAARAVGSLSLTAYQFSNSAAIGFSGAMAVTSGFQTTAAGALDIQGGFTGSAGVVVTVDNVLITVLA